MLGAGVGGGEAEGWRCVSGGWVEEPGDGRDRAGASVVAGRRNCGTKGPGIGSPAEWARPRSRTLGRFSLVIMFESTWPNLLHAC